MKALFLPLTLLLAILFSSLVTASLLSHKVNRWDTALKEASAQALLQNFSESSAILDACYEEWTESQQLFHILMEHDPLDDAETLFAESYAFLAQGEISEYCLTLHLLRVHLALIGETQQIALPNIL